MEERFVINNKMTFEDKVETYEFSCVVDNENKSFYFIVDSLANVESFVGRLNEQNETIVKIKSIIDEKIDDLQKRYDFGQNVYQGCPMHNLLHSINVLKELKREMGWEDE